MNKLSINRFLRVLLISSAVLLSACGRVSLSITDAPLDNAESIKLAITGVVFEANDGETTEVDFNPVMLIDLMTLTEGVTELLVSSESLPKGTYRAVTLKLDVAASSVIVEGSEYSLSMPADAESGLKVSKNFDVRTGNDINLVIDFDLRKSVHPQDSNNDYVLRPALRLLIENESGSVTGTVASSLLDANSQCRDNTGALTAAVYVFKGKDVVANDVDGSSTDPLNSTLVNADRTYTIAFLEEGDYTVSLTCEAKNDDPSVDDTLNFLDSHNVVITRSQSILQDF